jgi:hypothetical protein
MDKEEAKEYLDNYRKMYAELAPESFLEALDIMLNEPSLPSNLDEAVNGVMPISYGSLEVDCYGGSEPVYSREQMVEMFKAGAEWMAGQGASFNTKVGWIDGPTVLDWPDDILDKFKMGDEVIVQIRKKQL